MQSDRDPVDDDDDDATAVELLTPWFRRSFRCSALPIRQADAEIESIMVWGGRSLVSKRFCKIEWRKLF
jgi:hypothetical protein